MKFVPACLFLAALLGASVSFAETVAPWREGTHYHLITPAQPTSVPRGKVEVTEVFSYGCPACNGFLPVMHQLAAAMPANVVVDYVPASFLPNEDWPVFQRAYLTAQVLGIADKTHDAMFDAIWRTGELAILDPRTNTLKKALPTIQDVAQFYHRRTGVAVSDFVATAASMGIETRMGQADALIIAKYHVTSTPTIVVNGKYRTDPTLVDRDPQKFIALVKWLVAKEGQK